MCWQIEQEVLAYKRREVDGLGAMQFGVYGERGHINLCTKLMCPRSSYTPNCMAPRPSTSRRLYARTSCSICQHIRAATEMAIVFATGRNRRPQRKI